MVSDLNLSVFDYSCFLFCFKKPLVEVKKPSGKTPKPIVFWRALFRAYKGKLISSGLMKVVHDLLQFSGPLILKYIYLAFFLK